MYLVDMFILENLYFAINFKLSVLEQNLWAFIGYGDHLFGHRTTPSCYSCIMIIGYQWVRLFIYC